MSLPHHENANRTSIDPISPVVVLKWWSEANEQRPNRDAGMWMGIYAILGVLGIVGIFVSAWCVLVSLIHINR